MSLLHLNLPFVGHCRILVRQINDSTLSAVLVGTGGVAGVNQMLDFILSEGTMEQVRASQDARSAAALAALDMANDPAVIPGIPDG